MKKFDKVRWGIIGCGDVTEVKSGPAFSKVQDSELVAVMRRTGSLAKDYAERHGIPRWYDQAEELINDPEVDAVYIATPPGSHKEYTLKAAKAGKPVYVEKPMALKFSECNDMIAICKEYNVPLYVAYYRRSLPQFLKIKELLQAEAIGSIRTVVTNHYQQPTQELRDSWRVQPQISGGGLLFDMGSHTLDILDFLLGPVREVKGFQSNQAGNYLAEDIVTGTYLFESGVHGVGTWCFSAYNDGDKNEIIGSEGKITFSTFGNEPVILTTKEGRKEWSFEQPMHVHQPLIEEIVAELTGKGGICPSNGESAARTNLVLEKLIDR